MIFVSLISIRYPIISLAGWNFKLMDVYQMYPITGYIHKHWYLFQWSVSFDASGNFHWSLKHSQLSLTHFSWFIFPNILFSPILHLLFYITSPPLVRFSTLYPIMEKWTRNSVAIFVIVLHLHDFHQLLKQLYIVNSDGLLYGDTATLKNKFFISLIYGHKIKHVSCQPASVFISSLVC